MIITYTTKKVKRLMYTITKEFHFSASHQLDHLPDGHQCARLHGHNYIVKIELSGELDDRGFVFDYGDLAPLKTMIDKQLDHRHLNDVLNFHTTAENIAKWIFNICYSWWPQVTAVSVQEAPKTWATYRP